jgi:nicotinate-nucleotide pyrophosphorylase (carboxylating)
MIDRLLKYLEEDLGSGDITTDGIILTKTNVKSLIIAKENGIFAGALETVTILDHFRLEHDVWKEDGEEIKEGDIIADISGDAKTLFKIERLMLNIVSRMSGIATLTRNLSNICAPYKVRVMGTRKTTPGFREFEKRAIEIGGGLAHRNGLYDGVLIKDNHLAIVDLGEAINRAKDKNPDKRIEVEVSLLEEAVESAKYGADIIMLDNFTPELAKKAVDELRRFGLRGKVIIESSGGINKENIESYVKAGVDRISLGSLTTNAKWLDFSMKTEKRAH